MNNIGGYTPEEKVASIIASMQSNIQGRGITAKVFTIGANNYDSKPEIRLQITLHAYERDTRLARDVQRTLEAAFEKTKERICEIYEDQYGEEIDLLQLTKFVAANDALGYGYRATMGGAFMGNADQQVRAYLVRLIADFEVVPR